MRYELSDYEWAAIRPMLPDKARGVPRVDDRRVLDGIFLGATIWCRQYKKMTSAAKVN